MRPAAPDFPAVPPLLRGVWRRTLLEGPGIPVDTRTQVFWIQTAHWHGDLRIPADRPDFSACTDLGSCSASQRAWLDRQRGFAGVTEVSGGALVGAPSDTRPVDGLPVCQWHRRIDYQPPNGSRDIGTLVFTGDQDTLEEYGVDADYHETWVRVPESQGPQSVWCRPAAMGHDDLLLISGRCFFLLREGPMPMSTPEGPESDSVSGRLGMELSYGPWEPAVQCGSVVLSTLPWREGARVSLGEDWQPLDGGGTS